MDKRWINLPRYSHEYNKGIEDFITVAHGYTDSMSRTRCPCRYCCNLYYRHINDVKEHLYKNGMHRGYTRWEHHGEDLGHNANEVSKDDGDNQRPEGMTNNEEDNDDNMQDILHDLCEGIFMERNVPDVPSTEASSSHGANSKEGEGSKFESLFENANSELYPGCKVSRLSCIVKLFHMKIINGWSNKSLDMLLEFLKELLPNGETLPESHYEAKTMMRDLGLSYVPIHACKNDCALFWKEHEHRQECPRCGEPRYKYNDGKRKKVPNKVLRYFPLKPRLQRLFLSRKTAADMRWHKEKRIVENNVLRHPADSQNWIEFDKLHGWFAEDSRNVRLGLAGDGFNPFSHMSNSYSMWPVMLTVYNLPPWKCMKEPYVFMSLLIPGPTSPGNDIDVYMRPLIDELKDLWENGVITYDASTRQQFKMHAAILWTINDFPAYGNLSGWSTKGFMACPTCNMDTCSRWLKHGRKVCYMGSRRFLPLDHLWRRCHKQFDGTKEHRLPPKELSGDDVLKQLEQVTDVKFGKALANKKRKRTKNELNWSKKSIFFELPYWQTLLLRHNLDVMHIEKNICDNVFATLMNVEKKTKDNVSARMDLKAMGIRKDLHLIESGAKYVQPPAAYTLSVTEKKSLCTWLKSVKFPDGYASNISRCVNNRDGKILGLKSHDCHVLLQRLLPIAIRGYLNKDICTTLTELGFFFKELCSRTLCLEGLEVLQKNIVVVICKLERIFPPAFFDVMVHLAIHLPREAILGGPVQYRWMYPIERFLHTLKKYVRNKARPEGSIAEAYIANECLTFCSMYLSGIETRFNKPERNYDGGQSQERVGLTIFQQAVRPLGSGITCRLDVKELVKAQWYLLNNCEEVTPYLKEHEAEIQRQSSDKVEERQEKQFPKWFEKHMKQLRGQNSLDVTNDLYALACGPDARVKRFSGCIINGIRFHTKERDTHRKTQNSGVVVIGEHKGKNIDFYGILTDVIELSYCLGKQVFLFKCEWFDVGSRKTGIQIDPYFTSVNVSQTWYKDDPFILASQAQQVFYLPDTKLRGDWHVVQKIKPRNMYDIPELEEENDSEESETQNETFQDNELSGVDEIVLDDDNVSDEDMDPLPLSRDDMPPIDVDVDMMCQNMDLEMAEDDFINDEEVDIETDTSSAHLSDKEDMDNDDDTDIDMI